MPLTIALLYNARLYPGNIPLSTTTANCSARVIRPYISGSGFLDKKGLYKLGRESCTDKKHILVRGGNVYLNDLTSSPIQNDNWGVPFSFKIFNTLSENFKDDFIREELVPLLGDLVGN